MTKFKNNEYSGRIKFILFILILSLPIISHSESFKSESYEISILSACEEGHVTCDQIQFRLNDLKQGKVSEHIGQTVHSLCKDGVTPCRFLGYQFEVNESVYFVSEAGMLEVSNNDGEVTISEKGEWSY